MVMGVHSLRRAKSGETLMEVHSDADVQIVGLLCYDLLAISVLLMGPDQV